MKAEVRSGLDRAKLLPVGGGYLEATAGLNSLVGAFGRVEAGVRPLENITAFAYGQASTGLQTLAPTFEAGVGLRIGW